MGKERDIKIDGKVSIECQIVMNTRILKRIYIVKYKNNLTTNLKI